MCTTAVRRAGALQALRKDLGYGRRLQAEGTWARYTITDKSGTKLCFAEGTGLLTKIVDANNNTQRITWSGGKVTKVTDPTSRAVALVYDSSGHLVTVKTPSGRRRSLPMTAGAPDRDHGC